MTVLNETYDFEKHGAPLMPEEAQKQLEEKYRIPLSIQRMADLRSSGGGPIFIKLSHKAVRYPSALLAQWALAKLAKPLQDGVPIAPSKRRAMDKLAQAETAVA
jgi:hypothetical protein